MFLLFLACTASTPQDSDSVAITDTQDSGDTGEDTGEAFEPLEGFGELSGDCGVLDEGEWDSAEPFLFANVLDLGEVQFTDDDLLEASQPILDEGNLNQSSLYSEIFAFEVMARCELAALLKTEGAVSYDNPDGKKTDLLISVDERKIGLSVARAFTYPPGTPMDSDGATTLLEKKLGDLPISQDNASDADEWERSMLHIIAVDAQHGEIIAETWEGLDSGLKGDYGLMVTVTEGLDDELY